MITKCGEGLLQDATVLLQNVTLATICDNFVTKCDTCLCVDRDYNSRRIHLLVCFAISLILIICTYHKYVSPVEVFEKSQKGKAQDFLKKLGGGT